MGKAKGREATTRAESLLEALYAVIEGVEGVINHQLVDFVGPNNEVRFKDHTCVSLSAIRMADFIANPKWTQKIIEHSDAINSIDLSKSVINAQLFNDFISQPFEICFPGILYKEGAPENMKLDRDTAYFLAGNFEKHSIFKLDRCAKKIQILLKNHEIELPLTNIIMEIDSLSAIFVEDFYVAKAQHLGEVLTRLHQGIFSDLHAEYTSAYRSVSSSVWSYEYVPTFQIASDHGRAVYWELMNKVRRQPILPLVEASDHQRNRF